MKLSFQYSDHNLYFNPNPSDWKHPKAYFKYLLVIFWQLTMYKSGWTNRELNSLNGIIGLANPTLPPVGQSTLAKQLVPCIQ